MTATTPSTTVMRNPPRDFGRRMLRCAVLARISFLSSVR